MPKFTDGNHKKKKEKKKNVKSEVSMEPKKRTVIKLPPGFKKYITDPVMRKEFIDFAQGRENGAMPSMSELTAYNQQWETMITGKKYNPDDISINTYKLMRKDAQIQMGLKVIKLPIKAMKWWVVCRDEDIKAFVQFSLQRTWKSMLNAILNALDFGWSACEKVWEVQDIEVARKENGKEIIAYKGQAVLLKKLKDPDPLTVSIKTDKNGDFNGFYQDRGDAINVTVPAEKAFVFTNEKEFGNLYGKSLLRYAYDYWYWATLMYQFLNRYFERRGTPPVKARAPGGRTNLSNGTVLDNLRLAQKAGQSLTESSVVALPSSTDEHGKYKWDLEYLEDKQRANMFLSYIEHLNSMKLRALFVPERMLVQDSSMGARSVSETHLDVFLMGLEGLIQDILDHFNKYLIPQIVKYNFGDNAPPVYLETSGLSTESKNLLKQIVVALIKKDAHVPLDMIKALEELDLPIDYTNNVQPIKKVIDKEEGELETIQFASWRETDKYHRCRIKSPSLFIDGSFRTTDFNGRLPAGIKYIQGKLKSNNEYDTQVVIFDKGKYSLSEAKAWIKQKKFEEIGDKDAIITIETEADRKREESRLSEIRRLLE